MIAIIDYGVGNLFSLQCSLKKIGADSIVTGDFGEIERADRLILPGVGAFGDASEKLKSSGLDEWIKKQVKEGKPLLGICLGMQLLFEKSYEYGEFEGLALLKGEVLPLENALRKSASFSDENALRGSDRLKIPHMGWNSLNLKKGASGIFCNTREGEYVYFVHSYYANCPKQILTATAEYGIEVPAAVQKGRVYGTQFHPEKSGDSGLKILKAFAETEV